MADEAAPQSDGAADVGNANDAVAVAEVNNAPVEPQPFSWL